MYDDIIASFTPKLYSNYKQLSVTLIFVQGRKGYPGLNHKEFMIHCLRTMHAHCSDTMLGLKSIYRYSLLLIIYSLFLLSTRKRE